MCRTTRNIRISGKNLYHESENVENKGCAKKRFIVPALTEVLRRSESRLNMVSLQVVCATLHRVKRL